MLASVLFNELACCCCALANLYTCRNAPPLAMLPPLSPECAKAQATGHGWLRGADTAAGRTRRQPRASSGRRALSLSLSTYGDLLVLGARH